MYKAANIVWGVYRNRPVCLSVCPDQLPHLLSDFHQTLWNLRSWCVNVVKLHVFTFLVPCCNVCYDFCVKRCSIRLDFHLFCRRFMFYLCYLYLFTYTGVQHIVLCFCFVLFFLCTLSCQFLWIVHLCFSFRYSLTFLFLGSRQIHMYSTITKILKFNK
jgi:hypothetical protein